jgi:hypothetical protein
MRILTVAMATAVLTLGAFDDASAQQRGGQRAQRGPQFCENGQGHPVHGRSWCVEKGFGLGRAAWSRVGWGDIVLRGGRRSGNADRSVLLETLGDVVLRRLEGQRPDGRTPLTGRWRPAEGGGHILLIFAGSTPIAELADFNGNGRVDLVLVNGRRR